jgi:hypothetical protein
MTWLLAGLIGLVSGAVGYAYGYHSADSYWKTRIRERPSSIHLGEYPHYDGR